MTDLNTLFTEPEAPEQTGRQKTVIQPLIRGQHAGLARKIRTQIKGLMPCFGIPQEHFQHKNVKMDECNDSDKDGG